MEWTFKIKYFNIIKYIIIQQTTYRFTVSFKFFIKYIVSICAHSDTQM